MGLAEAARGTGSEGSEGTDSSEGTEGNERRGTRGAASTHGSAPCPGRGCEEAGPHLHTRSGWLERLVPPSGGGGLAAARPAAGARPACNAQGGSAECSQSPGSGHHHRSARVPAGDHAGPRGRLERVLRRLRLPGRLPHRRRHLPAGARPSRHPRRAAHLRRLRRGSRRRRPRRGRLSGSAAGPGGARRGGRRGSPRAGAGAAGRARCGAGGRARPRGAFGQRGSAGRAGPGRLRSLLLFPPKTCARAWN